jgi:hypothetical protein
MNIEQREYVRLLPKNNSFAALGRDVTKIGKIKDISMGGSSFEYIIHVDLKQNTARELDIFLTGDDFYLADLPCTVVYDVPVNTGNVFTSPFITKRCGIKFDLLPEDQMALLEYFLQKHTVGPASSPQHRVQQPSIR